MKLKTISARTVPEAMSEVRQTLGDEAVIVSSLKLPSGGVQLVVATGEFEKDKSVEKILFDQNGQTKPMEKMRSLLNMHRVPDLLCTRLISKCPTKITDMQTLLSDSLRQVLSFSPIETLKTKRAFLLTGMPGSGKTTTLLKWALNAKRQNLKVSLVSLDNQKAGAVLGLKSLADVLKMPLAVLDNVSQLGPTIQEYRKIADLVLIDSVGLNPWCATDMAFLAEVNRSCEGIEPILTLPAGLDSLECGETATQFARLGCTRLIATRMDVSGVYGNILNAAYTANLSLAYYGQGPMPTNTLKPLSAQVMAELLCQTALPMQVPV